MFKAEGQAGDFVPHGMGGTLAARPIPPHFDTGLNPRPCTMRRANTVSDHLHEWRERISLMLSGLDLAPDLARDIGSRRWLRGVATLIGLIALALSGWPGFSPVAAAPSMVLDTTARDQFRSQMITPLALGADTGRRMGATSAVVALAAAPERPRIDLVATLAQGDGFDHMLRRAGLARAEAARVANMVAGAVTLSDIEPGTQVDLTLGRRPAPGAPRALDSLSFRARFDLRLAVQRRAGELRLISHPIRVDDTPLRIAGEVGSSIYQSARAAGAPPVAVQRYLQVIGRQIPLDRVASTDRFDMIVAYKRAATGEREVGKLLYAAIYRDGRPEKQLVRWGKDGQFYEATGVGQPQQGLVRPVPGRITSGYGMRMHPILGYRRMHDGLDFRAAYGTPIHAVAAGTVEFAGRKGGYGNFVELRHAGGLESGYGHMSRIKVRRGQRVRRGQVIGYVGSTGLSTGPHLHYELSRNGRRINPQKVRFVTRERLSGRQLAAFRRQLRQLQQVKPGAALATLRPDSVTRKQPVREIDRLERPRRIG